MKIKINQDQYNILNKNNLFNTEIDIPINKSAGRTTEHSELINFYKRLNTNEYTTYTGVINTDGGTGRVQTKSDFINLFGKVIETGIEKQRQRQIKKK